MVSHEEEYLMSLYLNRFSEMFDFVTKNLTPPLGLLNNRGEQSVNLAVNH